MKKIKKLIVVTFMTFVTMLLSSCTTLTKMAVPEVKEAEFSFSVTYEINGEEKTYSDVYVCKYEGSYVSAFGDGGGIDWTGYIESTKGMPEVAIQTNDDGVIYIGLGFYPEYFMREPGFEDCEIPDYTLYIVYHSDDPDMVSIDRDIDFMEKYGIRIISYTYDKPIENSYEDKLTFGRLDFNIN